MKDQVSFKTCIRMALFCSIACLFVDNGTGISLEESGLGDVFAKFGAGRSSMEFKCDNGKIIVSNFKCDGDDDCGDGSDEKDCSGSTTRFKCNNGKIIRNAFKCDGDDDCGDQSDERDCATVQCAEDQFRCKSGKCIPQSERCDGSSDCRDKSDEASCENCSSAAFRCGSGECVPGSYQCNSRHDCSDRTDKDCPEGLTPSTWQEHWHRNSGNQNLTRVFADDDIVVYFDSEVNRQISWFFLPFSDAWKYVKQMFGPIGTNSILYIVLHEGKVGCVTASFFEKSSGHRTLIDCGQLQNKLAINSTALFEILLSPLGSVIREGSKFILNDADIKTCDKQITDIFFYDIYIHLRGESSAEVIAWESRKQTESVTDDRNKRYCFRDWFGPIYKKYGRSEVLNSYLENTKLYWPQHPVAGYTLLSMGQWVHFWSGSAGVDLQPMALKAFGWTTENQEEVKQARKAYPRLHYTVNKYTLAYDDNDIGFEFENYKNVSQPVYQTLSKAWAYIKSAYNNQNLNPKLNVILEARDDRYRTINCAIRSQNTLTKLLGGNVDNNSDLPLYGYIMKCGKTIFQSWDAITNVILDDMLIQMAKLALTHILVSTIDPAFGDKQIDKSVSAWPLVSDLDLESLIVYDIYIELGRTDDANRWKTEQNRKRFSSPEKSTYLFRDWYLEIYKRYDARFLKIVKEFVLGLNEHFNSTSTKKTRRLNVGEFVHFWSWTVNENLIDLAENCFKWNPRGKEQFYEARKKFPGFNYECDACYNTTEEAKPNTEPSNSTHTLIGIVVGVSATILIAAFTCFGIKFVRDQRRIRHLNLQIRNLTPKELDDFHHGNPNSSSRQAHAPIHSLPFKNEFEVPRERLIIDEKRVLGSGAFGIVKRGLLLGDDFLGTSDTVVAVKAVKRRVDITYFKAQLLEIKIMAYLGKHENIASLLATVTKNIIKCEVFFALEFCAKGDLYQYLNKHRRHFTDLWSKYTQKNLPSISSSGISCGSVSDSDSEVTISHHSTSKNSTKVAHVIRYRKMPESPVKISTLDLLTWSRQIACGMEYLGLKEVIHGDLAARNVLLTENSIVKISDFGLSRQLVNYSHYLKTSTTPVPWRWLAIESLTQMMFSLNSDIWSFGVTLWEIFTLGNLPYQGRNWDQEFVSELNAGLRLETPDFGNQEIYNLMLNCMKKEPAARIPFSQIGTQLERIKDKLDHLAPAPAKPSTSTSSSRGSSRVHYEPFKKFEVA